MLLEVLVVAIAAMTMGAAATLAWLRWRDGREDPGEGSGPVNAWAEPVTEQLTEQPSGTKYPIKIRISDDMPPTCTGDNKAYCVDGVEYQGSCDVETREIPPGARVVEGGCARYEPGDGLIPLRFRRQSLSMVLRPPQQ